MKEADSLNNTETQALNIPVVSTSFDDWYENEQPIFHCGQYDDKQIARSAYMEGAKVMQKLIASQKDIEPEFVEIVNKMFWDLI